MGINLRFTEGDWERIERDWKAWWAHELDRALIMIESTDTSFQRARILSWKSLAGEVLRFTSL